MIYTGQTHKEGNKPSRRYDEMWSIMRYPTQGLACTTIHHPELAPSPKLFDTFRELQAAKNWNPETFRSIYVPTYIREIAENKKARASLNYLYQNKDSGREIILLCSCAKEELCHRSIVYGLLDISGEYFSMYKEFRKPQT